MRPRGPQDEAKMGSRRAPWRRLGGLGPLGALLGRSWVVLGASWRAPGASWSRLGGSWAAPGASRGAPGAHLGLPGGSVWSFLSLCLRLPCEIARTTKFADSTALFEVFRGPGGPRIALKSLRNRSQARLGASGRLWRPRGAVLSRCGPLRGPSAWLLGRPWVAPDRSGRTGPRGT